VRGILLALGLLLVLAPAAAASHTFELPVASGDVIVRAVADPAATAADGAGVASVPFLGLAVIDQLDALLLEHKQQPVDAVGAGVLLG